MPSTEIANKWLGRLSKLNPASGRGDCHGKAPHKPLLLLALLDMAESGELLSPVFTRAAGLVLRFRSYGSLVVARWPTRLDIKMPFFYLSSQKFWRAYDSEMRDAKSDQACVVCEIDGEFFELLGDPGFRLKARVVLIAKYFASDEQVALQESMGLQGARRADFATSAILKEAEDAAKRKGRSAKFTVRVCAEYRYTCALTGYSCVTYDGGTVVDAAHIEAWVRTQNDDLTNGLALSKTAHWMFDSGLWSVNDDFRIIINSRKFVESGPEAIRLASYAGRHLQFDPSARLRPSVEYLRRHRQHFGIKMPLL